MSYTRQYHSRIAVHYSGSISYSYPASQSGGSGTAHYSGTTYEDVTVNIDVDTHSFDKSINNCNHHVNLLTGAVTATEIAQIAAVELNSKKVANTIVNGFFGYIRSEISQHIMELLQKIDAHLLHLRELANTCAAKKKQMENDYHRISERYLKIFTDLDHELENRVFELNRPAFTFRNVFNTQMQRYNGTDLVTTAAVSGAESSQLQARISASVSKRKAADAIQQANLFLQKQKKLQLTINTNMLNERFSAMRYSPLCIAELIDEGNLNELSIYRPSFLPEINEEELNLSLKTLEWTALKHEQKEKMQQYFISEVNNNYTTAENGNQDRIKNMIIALFDLDSTQSI